MSAYLAEQDGAEGRNIARFDIAEGLYILACDYGLYAVASALEAAGFRPSPFLTADALESLGREVYADHEAVALEADPYSVPEWAAALVAEVDGYEEDGAS